MKKLLLFLFTPLMFACGGDGKESISLSESETTLKYQGTYQINATSENSISYTSEDEYHATVSSSGLVKANKVGETNILVSDGNSTRKFKVTVSPQSSLYDEPLTDWSLTKSQVISKLGTPASQADSSCIYQPSNSAISYIMYLFTKAGKIKSVGVVIQTAYTSELATFLTERYTYAGQSNDTFLYYNQSTTAKATTIIGLSLYSTSYWFAIYIPNTSTKSSKPLDFLPYKNELKKYIGQ